MAAIPPLPAQLDWSYTATKGRGFSAAPPAESGSPVRSVAVLGAWHQGVVISACLADLGHSVKVATAESELGNFRDGIPPVGEPLLSELIRSNLAAGRLQFTANPSDALDGADLVYLSADTPVGVDDVPDIRPVQALARLIGRHRRGDITLIVTAQVPVGTTASLADSVVELSPAYRCDYAYVPEFLRLGTAVENFRTPDRIVVGCDEPAVARRVAAIYESFDSPIVSTSVRTAEMAKHAANAFLATSISFANEISDLCQAVGADAADVEQILKLDPRIGPRAFLSPGLGFAGGTLGREVRTLQRLGREYRVPTTLANATWRINKRRPEVIAQMLREEFETLDGCQVGVLGLTYKEGTSTLRRAISLDIVRGLASSGVRVKAWDPLANYAEVSNLPPMEICDDAYAVATESDAVVLITGWEGMDELDFGRLLGSMRGNLFIDAGNVLAEEPMEGVGFKYRTIGRRP